MAEKLKATPYQDGFEIIGNREGLKGLAAICQQLADLPENDNEARRLGNHYHYADYINNLEEGSIVYDPEPDCFGLVMKLENGVLWYMGPYGSLAETVQAMSPLYVDLTRGCLRHDRSCSNRRCPTDRARIVVAVVTGSTGATSDQNAASSALARLIT